MAEFQEKASYKSDSKLPETRKEIWSHGRPSKEKGSHLKKISILGSTGSIGRQTLDVISQHPEKFDVVGLTAGKNIELLKEQILKFRPQAVSVQDEETAAELIPLIKPAETQIFHSLQGAEQIAVLSEADLVVSAMVGASGLRPTLAAAKAGKDIALANKESLVIAGLINEINSVAVSSSWTETA